MKKLLLATGIVLGLGLGASAQEKKPAATKGEKNRKMLVHQNNTDTKDQILQNKENGVNPGTDRTRANSARKSTRRTTKTKTAGN